MRKKRKVAAGKRRRRLIGSFIALAVVAAAAGVVWAASVWLQANVLSTLPENLAHLQAYRPPSNCIIFDAAGNLIDEFYVERRIWMPIKDLPEHVWQAFVAAEDRRFFAHGGVDPAGIVRALISNLRHGGVSQGGSTITQQIVKNLLVGHERSYTRKLREAVLAIRLERELTKKQLLELYINYIYLGSGNYGVEAAAEDYFGKHASEIDAGQAATLAGLVPSPSRYSPHRHPEQAIARRSYVLGRMVEEGYVTLGDARRYAQAPVVIPVDRPERSSVGLAYMTEVRREIRRLFGPVAPLVHGFHVYTTVDMEVQAHAETALREALQAVDQRRGRRGIIGHLAETEVTAFLDKADGLDRDSGSKIVRPPEAERCFTAVVAKGKGLDTLLAGPYAFSLRSEDRSASVRGRDGTGRRVLSSDARAGDLLKVCAVDENTVRLDPKPWAEGGVVVLDNQSGRVRALVGGYKDVLEGFVRATQARRQPGSSFKPYVYGTALKAGKNQLDTVYDGPISLPGGNGKIWSPGNFDDKYFGNLPMRNALAKSLNTVSVRLTYELGPRRVAETARSMGVRSPLRSDMSIALGSSEVTPMDQALGFSAIARMGAPTEPVFIDSIRDSFGKLIGVAGGSVMVGEENLGKLPGSPLPRALPAGVAYELADMMREVVRSGTARKAYKDGYDRAGKTGTTNEYVDAWFVGFDRRHTTAVWVGSDGTASLGDRETGGVTSLPAWIKIMDSIEGSGGERLPIPDQAVLVNVGGSWYGFPRGKVRAGDLPVRTPGLEPLPRFPSDS
ncbi:MAG: PBP1A family penicillin-binding protein [Deltaproteobacteria bacterium]|nr:PBP1A family penicillin-binding protein [Deltaproteobacteria bacterium]